VLENFQDSQSAPGFANFVSPISPIHSSSNHFDFDYSMQTSLSQPRSQWSNSNDSQNLDPFSASQDTSTFTTPFNTYSSPVDGAFTGFDTAEVRSPMPGLSTTPPSSTFAATGLPFSGLEFIRNYNPAGYSTGEQEALWHSFDPGAFGYDPELPFTLGDFPVEGQEGTH
jgi:hypothetical protein